MESHCTVFSIFLDYFGQIFFQPVAQTVLKDTAQTDEIP